MEMVLSIATLAFYAVVMTLLAAKTAGKNKDNVDYYTVTDRKTGIFQGSLSIAATWIWAPALFVASTQAYTNGWVGVFWFIVPNILTLLFMIPFAKRMRERHPNGFTLSGFMETVYGKPVRGLYQLETGLLSTLSMSVNLLAGGTVLSILSGMPLWLSSVLLLATALGYTWRYGIKSSLVTDAIQMIFIIGALILFVPVAIGVKGFDSIVAGIQGINGVDGLFTSSGIGVAVGFGIISAIGLMAGPIGDQSFWQRAFSIDKNKLAKSFGWGAVAFGMVPIMMSVFGFIAAGTQAEINNAGYVNLEVIQSIFPVWVVVPFLLMLLSGLLSTIDSQMLALGSLTRDYNKDLKTQKMVMIAGALIALAVANLPGMSVLLLFLIYGTLRAATFLVTVLTLLNVKLHSKAVVAGLVSAMAIGYPISIYGNLNGLGDWKLWGIILTVSLSGIVAYVATKAIDQVKEKAKA